MSTSREIDVEKLLSVASWECQRCHALNGFGDMECVACGHDGRKPVVFNALSTKPVVSSETGFDCTQADKLRARTTGTHPAIGPMDPSWLRQVDESQEDYAKRMAGLCQELAGKMFGGRQSGIPTNKTY